MLLTRTQIEGNLRRTVEKGLISLLNQYQLEQLALKYFGVYQDEQLIGYQCPYSGELITNFNDIVLEHIIPVSSNGGTVLFNCIPTSKEVNGAAQKGAKHLIEWWTNSSYWIEQAPVRLEKILNYMLEAYELVFREYTIEEVENSYLEIEPDEAILEEEDNLTLDERTESQLSKQTKNNGIHSYLGFILDCITTLEKNNINTTSIKEKLANLEEKNIFKDIEKYQLYQNIIKQLIISRLGDNNSNYLSYNLNFDTKKLMDSINLDNQQDIYNELDLRLKNIEQLLTLNNLSIVEYFKSLRDIADIDIIYKNINEISQEDINIFLVNIKIGIDTKIDIFIDMLSDKQYTSCENGKPNDNNIFKQKNKVPFKGYEGITGLNTSYFWSHNSNIIIQKLNFLEVNSKNNEEKEKYQRARRKIEEYNFTTNLEKRIDCFIEMLTDKQYTSYENGKPNDNNIFKRKNKIPFKGYESIIGLNISQLWSSKSNVIRSRLNFLEANSKNNEEKEKYQRAKRAIEEYDFTTNLEKRIDCFIEMIHDKKYTSYENGKPNDNNIFSSLNKISFNGYENIDGLNTSEFWQCNSETIINRINYLESHSKSNEEKEKYQRVRSTIEEYNFTTNLEKRIDCFIEMLADKQYTSYENGKPDNNNILKVYNKIAFQDYENIKGLNTSQFWSRNSDIIIQRLNFLEANSKNNEEKEKYQKAKIAIKMFNFYSNYESKIDCYIEMLADKQYTSYENGKPNDNNIFKQKNKVPFKGYEGITGLNTSYFWTDNSGEIIERLNYLKENTKNEIERKKYEKAKRAIEEYNFTTNLEKRIDCYIEMLTDKQYTSYENGKPNNKNIFRQKEGIPFKGYENIEGLNTSYFWSRNSDIIIQRLNFLEANSKNNEEKEKYQKAKIAIKMFNFYSNYESKIDCYIEMLTDKQYTSYEDGKPNDNNIFKQTNKILFKGYEDIKGLNTSQFWTDNSGKIIERLNYLKENTKNDIERQKYEKAKRAIEEYNFTTNLEKKIYSFMEMLTDKKYTSYKNGKSNENNIFSSRNKISFKGYESIEGLNTAMFWNNNSQKLIIPLLFYNKQYDIDNKLYIDSKKDYSTKKYDAARNAVLEYLSLNDKTTYSSIEQYIDKLEQKEKKNAKILELINLRNGLRQTLELLRTEEERLVAENNQLRDTYQKKQSGIEIRRAV